MHGILNYCCLCFYLHTNKQTNEVVIVIAHCVFSKKVSKTGHLYKMD